MVHKEQPPKPERRIVVGVDSSTGSTAALRWALDQARLTGATVEAVAAWHGPAMYGYSYGVVPMEFDDASIVTIAEKALVETVAQVMGKREHREQVTTHVMQGPASQVLLEAAKGAQMLVVGSRGHGAFAGMLLGSVSQHCVQHATCPTVVIPE
jgi:nucleotide-binding universal stress UspA family protein